jgi:hypothetical protein
MLIAEIAIIVRNRTWPQGYGANGRRIRLSS